MCVFCDIYESTFPSGNEILYAPLHLHHQQHDSRSWCIINEENTYFGGVFMIAVHFQVNVSTT